MERTFDSMVRASLSELITRARSINNEQNIIIDEVEFRFGTREHNFFNSDHTVVQFQKMLGYLRANYPPIDGINNQETSLALDIIVENSDIPEMDGLRVTVNGPDDFNSYCKQNNLNELHNTQFERKKRISNINVKDYSFLRLSASTETNMYVPEDNTVAGVSIAEINNMLNSMQYQKYYRLKKRYSFYITIDNNSDYQVRVDMTDVRQGRGYSLRNSKVKETKPRYEIEIEFLGKVDTQRPSSLINNNDLIQFLGEFVAAYNDTTFQFLLSDLQKKNVLDNYLNIFYKNQDTSDMKKFPKKYFVGTDIRPLEHKHIVLEAGKTALVKEQYSVSVKADGNRMLLFLRGQDNNVYGIDSNLNVKVIALLNSPPLQEGQYYLVDGELIKTKLDTTVFLCFDILYAQDTDVRNKKFHDEKGSRYELLQKFVKETKVTNDGAALRNISYKRLLNMTSLSEFIQHNEVDYETDGLIFTPSGKYPESINEIQNIRLKWKPVEMQSIDFKLKMDKTENNKYNIISTSSGPKAYATLTYISKKEYPTFNVKDKPEFSKIALDVNENGKPVFENKILENGTIVECVFIDGQWKIMRLRLDKKEPNGAIAVFSNWKLIIEPISMAELTGVVTKQREKLAQEEPKITLKNPEKITFVPSKKLTFKSKKETVPVPAPVPSEPVPVPSVPSEPEPAPFSATVPSEPEPVPVPVPATAPVPAPVPVPVPETPEPDYTIDTLRQKIKAALKRTDKIEKLTPLIAQNRLVSTGEYTKEGLLKNRPNVAAAVNELKNQ